MAAEFNQTVQFVETVVNTISRNRSINSLQITDRIVLDLQICSDLLEPLAAACDYPLNETVQDLRMVIEQLLVEWETRLVRLESTSAQFPGRPKATINIEMLEFLREIGNTWQQCADYLMVSRTTLWRRAQEMGIPTQFSNSAMLTDDEIDTVVRMIQNDSPNSGIVMVWGELKSRKIYIPRRRVRESLLRVCPRAVEVRLSRTVHRRVYSVPCSNALWHMDGLHCLIRWRIVIHGCIDGFSRKITYLHASNNNRADTVLKLFLEATHDHGWPSRTRSDKGGENFDVARAMLIVRGTGRSSHIAGASIHNQRIERLWRDTFRCVCHTFYAMFYDMEESGILSPTNEVQLFCLHFVFLPRLNRQLEQFMNSWNHHHLRSEHGLTPNQLWFRGMNNCNFQCNVDPAAYGIEEGQPNPFDMGRIEIPATDVNISSEQLQTLHERINPLSQSDYNGLDLFIDTFTHVTHLINQ